MTVWFWRQRFRFERSWRHWFGRVDWSGPLTKDVPIDE